VDSLPLGKVVQVVVEDNHLAIRRLVLAISHSLHLVVHAHLAMSAKGTLFTTKPLLKVTAVARVSV
jgi:hypothetical protein